MNKRYAALVYQAGIANVFELDTFSPYANIRNAKRILQSTFRDCELFARGLRYAGFIVNSYQCNMAGDITNASWSDNLDDAPFSEKFNPVF